MNDTKTCGQMLRFLLELQAAVPSFRGVPAGVGVIVVQEQDLRSAVDLAVARAGCAILLGMTGGESRGQLPPAGPEVTAQLEVEIVTPAGRLSTEGPRTLDITEDLIAQIHGWRVDRMPSGFRVPSFTGFSLRAEGAQGEGPQYLIANARFAVRIALTGTTGAIP